MICNAASRKFDPTLGKPEKRWSTMTVSMQAVRAVGLESSCWDLSRWTAKLSIRVSSLYSGWQCHSGLPQSTTCRTSFKGACIPSKNPHSLFFSDQRSSTIRSRFVRYSRIAKIRVFRSCAKCSLSWLGTASNDCMILPAQS